MFKNLNLGAIGITGRESELIELALSNGFKGVDLDLAEFAEQVKTQGMPRASRLLVSSRLKISSFPLPVHWQEESDQYKQDLARLPELAKIAQELGCTRTVTLIESGSDTRPYHENFEFHRRRFSELAETLQPFKIRLGIGFLAPVGCRAGNVFQFMQKADEVLLLLRNIASPNLGLAFDSWHWHLGGGTVDQLRSLAAEKIVTVSVADADTNTTAAIAKLTDRRVPGQGGAIDIAAILTALAELRYDGPVSPTPDQSQFAGLSREKIIKEAGAALDQAWKAAGLNTAGKLTAVPGR